MTLSLGEILLVNSKKGQPVKTNVAKCTGCLICELRCSLRFEKAFNPSKAAIHHYRVMSVDHEFEISFEGRCDNCGICARYCPYGALAQEKKGAT